MQKKIFIGIFYTLLFTPSIISMHTYFNSCTSRQNKSPRNLLCYGIILCGSINVVIDTQTAYTQVCNQLKDTISPVESSGLDTEERIGNIHIHNMHSHVYLYQKKQQFKRDLYLSWGLVSFSLGLVAAELWNIRK